MIEKIEAIICAGEDILPSMLHTPARDGVLNTTRQMIMWFAKNETSMSLSEIANYFGRTNHATALSNIRKINDRIDTEPSFLIKINRYQNKINASKHIFARIDAVTLLIGNLYSDVSLIENRITELKSALQSLNNEISELYNKRDR
jgi:hypothetical protein